MDADVAIIIATVNRPGYLRGALRSVAAQSARGRIREVIVSENGGGEESRLACAEFPELPIHYTFRSPATSAMEHGKILLGAELPACPFTAILHDDDWWLPSHLQNALVALERHPKASAYYSSFFEVQSESSRLFCHDNLPFWFGSGYPECGALWSLTAVQTALSSLLATPGRFSTMVARTSALGAAAESVLNLNNPFDIDRMLTLQLSHAGPILYWPMPEVFIRVHPGQDTWSFSDEERMMHMKRTTAWILDHFGGRPAELVAAFRERVEECPESAREHLLTLVNLPWCAVALQERAPGVSLLPRPQPAPLQTTSRTIDYLKLLTPPLLLKAVRSLCRES